MYTTERDPLALATGVPGLGPSLEAAMQNRTLREEITSVLKDAKGTPKQIATAISAPVRAVREELTAMGLQGAISSRVQKSGEVVYSLRHGGRLVIEPNLN